MVVVTGFKTIAMTFNDCRVSSGVLSVGCVGVVVALVFYAISLFKKNAA